MTWVDLRQYASLGLLNCGLLGMLAVGASYLFYELELQVSSVPFEVTAYTLAILFVGIAIIFIRSQLFKANTAADFGLVYLFSLVTVYLFFGLFGFVFYIVYAPLPPLVRIVGYVIGFGGHLWWIWLSYKDTQHALEKTRFRERAYEDHGDEFLHYDREKWNKKILALMNKRDLPHQGQMWVALAIAPVAPFVGRLFSPDFQALGVTTFMAYLSLPLSLWLLRAAFFPFVSLIWYPLKLKHLTGKTVVLAS